MKQLITGTIIGALVVAIVLGGFAVTADIGVEQHHHAPSDGAVILGMKSEAVRAQDIVPTEPPAPAPTNTPVPTPVSYDRWSCGPWSDTAADLPGPIHLPEMTLSDGRVQPAMTVADGKALIEAAHNNIQAAIHYDRPGKVELRNSYGEAQRTFTGGNYGWSSGRADVERNCENALRQLRGQAPIPDPNLASTPNPKPVPPRPTISDEDRAFYNINANGACNVAVVSEAEINAAEKAYIDAGEAVSAAMANRSDVAWDYFNKQVEAEQIRLRTLMAGPDGISGIVTESTTPGQPPIVTGTDDNLFVWEVVPSSVVSKATAAVTKAEGKYAAAIDAWEALLEKAYKADMCQDFLRYHKELVAEWDAEHGG